MPRSGLTKEKVVEAAVAFIEEHGTAEFSMRALADRLDIKTASLYNHVESMEALMVEICAYALRLQHDTEMNAIFGKKDSEAIIALANAYRNFAKEHKQLYRLIINMAASCGDKLLETSSWIIEPFMTVLDDRDLTEDEKYHWQRVFRGIVHGFASQEDAGFFSHLRTNVDDSFEVALECYIIGLNQAEKRSEK